MSLQKVLNHKTSIVEKVKASLANPLFKTYLKLEYTPENESLLRDQVFNLNAMKNKSPFIKLSDVPMKHIVGAQQLDYYSFSIPINRETKDVPVFYNAEKDTITIKDIQGDVESFAADLSEVCTNIFKDETFNECMKITKYSNSLVITKPHVKKEVGGVAVPKLSYFWYKTIRLLLQESVMGSDDGYYQLAVKDFNYEGIYKQISKTVMNDWINIAKSKKIELEELAEKEKKLKKRRDSVVIDSSSILPEVFVEDLQKTFGEKK